MGIAMYAPASALQACSCNTFTYNEYGYHNLWHSKFSVSLIEVIVYAI